MNTPPRAQIVEVSPRDGLQAESRTLSTDVKLELLGRLADAGHTVIEATSFVGPTVVPQLADADDLMRRLKRRPGVRYPVLVPNDRGLDRAMAAGADEIAVFVAASESYSLKNLRRSRDEALGIAVAVATRAKAAGLRVRGYISMVIGDPNDGPTTADAVVAIAQRLLGAGCDGLSLGDTTGVGTPADVRRLLDAHRDAGITLDRVGVHFHDTYGQGLANVLTALELGVTAIDASIGGIGGSPFAKHASGNLATEDVIWMLDGMGVETGIDVRALAATSRWMAEQLGRNLPGRAAKALAS
ncbi:MAG TPA: hydroxymethylglutaryl-CoA lyase [Candidatus Limnocylindria bacterium]|nr:hydroxymethylglutaryl-CoA lyase [Candidatus Limnocylindria bacterium]